MTRSQRSRRFLACLCALGAMTCTPLAAQTDTTFTYQGTLNDQGAPANGAFNLTFSLFDALAGGGQVGSTIVMNGAQVTDGLLTAELDFGASAFDNTGRWLQIAVNGSTLSPRQPISRSPYSIQTRGIFVDANGKVGIGTATPIAGLHVVGDGVGTVMRLTNGGGGGTALIAGDVSGSGRAASFFGITTNDLISVVNDGSGKAAAFDGDVTFVGGTVSIGSSESSYPLYVESSTPYTIYAKNTANTSTAYGGLFVTNSTAGRGVFGSASASSGITYGGRFETSSSSGRAVFGLATASSGETYGGRFENWSTSGRAVYGNVIAGSGETYGGRFESRSTSGRGVYGYAYASTGLTDGVFGRSDSTSGRGICGWAPASTGTTYGVFGTSDSTSGAGVKGEARASTGVTYGGRFESSSTVGRGVFGFASASSGVNFGVVGHSNSSSGFDFWASGAGTNYGSNSSRRWKSNIRNIGQPLDKIARLRGVYFDWDTEHGGHHDLGMIAEEVGEVLPEIVQYEENGIDAIGMDYSKMTPLLVEAVNALRSQRDSDLASLHAENDDLRQQLSNLQQVVEQLASNQEKENDQ